MGAVVGFLEEDEDAERVQARPELVGVEFSFSDDLERSLLALLAGLADDA